jgi:hypothetical protein
MAAADTNFAAGAAEYLQSKNYKALAEYMSAEVCNYVGFTQQLPGFTCCAPFYLQVLFKRPEDPVTFIRDLLNHKLQQVS